MCFLNGSFLGKEKGIFIQANSRLKAFTTQVSSTYNKVAAMLIFSFIILFACQTSNAACPAGYTSIQTFYSSPTGCVITFTYCYGINGYLHELILTNIEFSADQNDPSCAMYFENHRGEILDEMLIQLAQGSSAEAIFGEEVRECPNSSCVISIKEGLCYLDWYWNKHTGKWSLILCDDTPRTCNSTVYVCYTLVNGVKVYSVMRFGIPPFPCHEDCKTNCW